jgi:penicillin amidase
MNMSTAASAWRVVLASAIGLTPDSVAAKEEAAPAPESLSLAGLMAPVEIRVDRWGVPHIYAQSEADVFFAQGVNAARDRLFQIDLWRRRGLGRLSEVLGPDFVEQDRAARLFLYRADMDREWRSYSSNGTRAAELPTRRFVEGINAYVDWLQANPSRLPWEFRFLDYLPDRWTADDVIRIRSHGLAQPHIGSLANTLWGRPGGWCASVSATNGSRSCPRASIRACPKAYSGCSSSPRRGFA